MTTLDPRVNLNGHHEDRVVGLPEGWDYATAVEFVLRPHTPPAELAGPFLRKGQRTVLFGPPGEGKSTMALAMIRAALTGEEFLGHPVHEPVKRVLVIDTEQGGFSIKRKVIAAGLDDAERLTILSIPGGMNPLKHSDERAWLDQNLAGWDLVVVDPLYGAILGTSAKDGDEINPWLKMWDVWRDQHGFGFLLLHHTRKLQHGQGMSMDDMHGAAELQRWAEVILGYRATEGTGAYVQVFKDRDSLLQRGDKLNLKFHSETGTYETVGKPVQAERKRSTLQAVYQFITEHGGKPSGTEIRDALVALDYTPTAVRDCLTDNVKKGLLESTEHESGRGKRYWKPSTDDDPSLTDWRSEIE